MGLEMPNAYEHTPSKPDLARDIKGKEYEFFNGNLKYNDMIAHFGSEQPGLSENEKKDREWMFETYTGMKAHHNANLDFIRFNMSLDKKKIESLSRAEYNQKFDEFENKEELIDQENKALEFYEKALGKYQDQSRVDANNLKTLALDLRYRQAQRIEDAEERESVLERIDKEYRLLAQEIPETGKRAEVELIIVMNSWLKKKRLDHVVSIFHALPLDDHKNKIDNILVYGDKLLEINLKSYEEDDYLPSANEEKVDNEKRKISGKRIPIININPSKLQKALHLGKTDQVARQILSPLQGGLQHEDTEQRHKNITTKGLLQNNTTVQDLIRLEYLTPEDSNNIPAILEAKKRIEADLRNQKTSDKIKEKILQIKEQS